MLNEGRIWFRKTAFRVCADPANSPMATREGTGFENKLAELFAERLGLPLDYAWFPMATGFVRKTLKANRCDVIIGFSQGHELGFNTNHYYTTAYSIVTRADSDLSGVGTLTDPRLKAHRIGVIAGMTLLDDMGRHLKEFGAMKNRSQFSRPFRWKSRKNTGWSTIVHPFRQRSAAARWWMMKRHMSFRRAVKWLGSFEQFRVVSTTRWMPPGPLIRMVRPKSKCDVGRFISKTAETGIGFSSITR